MLLYNTLASSSIFRQAFCNSIIAHLFKFFSFLQACLSTSIYCHFFNKILCIFFSFFAPLRVPYAEIPLCSLLHLFYIFFSSTIFSNRVQYGWKATCKQQHFKFLICRFLREIEREIEWGWERGESHWFSQSMVYCKRFFFFLYPSKKPNIFGAYSSWSNTALVQHITNTLRQSTILLSFLRKIYALPPVVKGKIPELLSVDASLLLCTGKLFLLKRTKTMKLEQNETWQKLVE